MDKAESYQLQPIEEQQQKMLPLLQLASKTTGLSVRQTSKLITNTSHLAEQVSMFGIQAIQLCIASMELKWS